MASQCAMQTVSPPCAPCQRRSCRGAPVSPVTGSILWTPSSPDCFQRGIEVDFLEQAVSQFVVTPCRCRQGGSTDAAGGHVKPARCEPSCVIVSRPLPMCRFVLLIGHRDDRTAICQPHSRQSPDDRVAQACRKDLESGFQARNARGDGVSRWWRPSGCPQRTAFFWSRHRARPPTRHWQGADGDARSGPDARSHRRPGLSRLPR